MSGGESKALSFENQIVSTSINEGPKGHIKPIDLTSTQSSVLSPQSSNLSPENFEQVCAELLRSGHGVKFRAPGNSMYPTIRADETVVVEPIKPSDVQLGDIILYNHSSGVVAHRVIQIVKKGDFTSQPPGSGSQSDLTQSSVLSPQPIETQSSTLSPQYCFTLRGDSAINYDAPINSEQILGKVVSIEKKGRHLDPYCLRIKFLYKARRLASHLKRLFFSHRATQTDTDNFLCRPWRRK